MKVIKVSKLKGDGHCYLKPEWLLEDSSGPITDFLNRADIGEKIQLEVLNLTDLQFYKAVMKQAVTNFDEQWEELGKELSGMSSCEAVEKATDIFKDMVGVPNEQT